MKVSFLSMLAIVFITLKLCSVIDWSWWWILLPLWGPLAFLAAIALLAFIGFLVRAIAAALWEKYS